MKQKMPLIFIPSTLAIWWAGLIIILISLRCDTTEPPIIPPDNAVANTITLTVKWTDLYRINVKWNKAKADTLEPFTYRLTQTDEQGNKTTKDFTFIGKDTSHTTGESDSLLQGKSYWFKVEGYSKESKLKDTSKTVVGKTLLPTSHDIVWTIDTLGQPGNFLNDVWGLDENNVWAVGYLNLPNGESGIIKWNGSEWKSFPTSSGVKYGIFGFSQSNIFVVGESINRGFIAIWNGNNWTEYRDEYFLSRGDTVYPLRAVWGSATNDVWAVGDKGTIIHWNGDGWKKVDARITTRINAVWGTSQSDIYIVAVSGVNSALYKYNGSVWVNISNNIGIFATTLWKTEPGKLLIGGTALLEYNGSTFQQVYIPGRSRGVIKIRGNNLNNIFSAGDFGEITHYNGLSWKDINEFEVPDGRYRVLRSVWCSEHKVFIVGVDENRAIIINGSINY